MCDYYYRLLDISPCASNDELKEAYRKAVKRWHPDAWPEKDREYAEFMLKEINIAYHELIDGERNKQDDFLPEYKIKALLIKNKTAEAEALLNKFCLRTAQWYYLKGLVRLRSGSESAAEYLRTAYSIDPSNAEYKRLLRYAIRYSKKSIKSTINKFINDAFNI